MTLARFFRKIVKNDAMRNEYALPPLSRVEPHPRISPQSVLTEVLLSPEEIYGWRVIALVCACKSISDCRAVSPCLN